MDGMTLMTVDEVRRYVRLSMFIGAISYGIVAPLVVEMAKWLLGKIWPDKGIARQFDDVGDNRCSDNPSEPASAPTTFQSS